MYYTLFTYKNLEEIKEIFSKNEVLQFEFLKTLELLNDNPNCIINITNLVYFLDVNKGNIYPAYTNLCEMTNETKVIVQEDLSQLTLELFPELFDNIEPFLKKNEDNEISTGETVSLEHTKRGNIYYYHTQNDLEVIFNYANDNNIPFSNFSSANSNLRSELEKFTKFTPFALIDLTSIAYIIEDNKNIIYTVELFLNQFPNTKIISNFKQTDKLLKYFPLYIENALPISSIIPSIEDKIQHYEENEEKPVKKLIDFENNDFDEYFKYLDCNLIGHSYFKTELRKKLFNFITLNKIGEQKVFSIFLFGTSGIGKTEVARLFANGLDKNNYLAKINFQNYSSQDSLNSLIGSPAGYIGCEHGELSEKIKKGNVGILLCDEFEKATYPVHTFFLELLEDGKFTDSMAREYDLDGYVIVFTSNIITEKSFKESIPIELQTRFDLICKFDEPTKNEKCQFLDLLFEQLIEKFKDQFINMEITVQEKFGLYNFGYENITALRDIKRIFKQRMIELLVRKNKDK